MGVLRAGSGNPAMPFGLAPVVVLTFVTVAETAGMAIVPGTLPLLQDEFGFGDAAGGAVPLATVVVGGLFLLPAGYVTDHFRRTWILALAMLAMALTVLGSAFAVSFAMIFGLQIVFGTANTFDNPALNSALVDYYAPSVRGRLFAVQRLGFVLGFSVGIAVAGAVGDAFGWEWSFVAVAPVLLVAAASVLALPEPRRGALDRESVAATDDTVGALDALVEAEVDLEHERPGWRQYTVDARALWRVRTVRLLVLGQLVAIFGFNGLSFWLTSFFERTHDLSEGAAAGLTGLVGIVAGVGGALGGGVVGDRLARRGRGARITFTAVSLGVGALLMALGLALPALAPQFVFVLAGSAGAAASIPNLAAAFSEVLPGARRGTGFALYFLVTALGVAFGPLFMGSISALSGSLRVGMVVAMLVSAPGAVVTLRGRATVDADADAAAGTSIDPR